MLTSEGQICSLGTAFTIIAQGKESRSSSIIGLFHQKMKDKALIFRELVWRAHLHGRQVDPTRRIFEKNAFLLD